MRPARQCQLLLGSQLNLAATVYLHLEDAPRPAGPISAVLLQHLQLSDLFRLPDQLLLICRHVPLPGSSVGFWFPHACFS